MKNYIGISRDHTGSMSAYRLCEPARKDYNSTIAAIRTAAETNNQPTIVSVVKCGHGSEPIVFREIVNSPVTELKQLSSYPGNAGGTPLFDSVAELIDILEAVPDKNDPNVSFMVMATSDGGENCSRISGSQLAGRMKTLMATDKWTFVFRVPKGYGRSLQAMGIPEGNIFEWDQTSRGAQQAEAATTQAFGEYFVNRKSGMTSTNKFYANLADVDLKQVQSELEDITDQVFFFDVKGEVADIRKFVEDNLSGGEPMAKGAAFYQLVKTEPKVQDYKRIAIRSKTDQKVYSGDAARQMLALPTVGSVRLAPDELGDYEVFIQSTSVNRKLPVGSKLMYWHAVGQAFKEGPSAR